MNPVLIMGLGALTLFGLYFQINTWLKWRTNRFDDTGKRAFFWAVKIPVLMSFVALAGLVTFDLIQTYEGQTRGNPFQVFLQHLWAGIRLVFGTAIQSVFGILLATFGLAYELYCLAIYGHLRPIPMMESIREWLLGFAPTWFGNGWFLLQLVWSILTGAIVRE